MRFARSAARCSLSLELNYAKSTMAKSGTVSTRWVFPEEREPKRKALLAAVERVRETVAADADEAEAIATLPEATVDALYESGLFAFKLPRELGGAEADPVIQFEVIEALSYVNGAAGWCMMNGATSVALPGAFLPDEAIEQMFPAGQVPKVAGSLTPKGKAIPVEGGYLLDGHWSFASGIRYSQWLSARGHVVRDEQVTGEQRRFVFRTGDALIHDNWQVAGLKATGSNDFSVSGLFVPEAFTWDVMDRRPRRGGPLYDIGLPGFVANEHAAFALGIGRRALDAIVEMAGSKTRGFGLRPSKLAGRSSFQREVGECDLRLRAARALAIEILEEAWTTVRKGATPDPRQQADMRSSATYATEVAADVASQAFRYGGGAALYLSNVLQRCLRDINAGAQHLMVSDTAYEIQGQLALGLDDINPMG